MSENFDMSNFEQSMFDMLLIEELAISKAEVFENVVFEGKKRYYIENLSERDYSLENTTPYQLKIGDKVIEEHSWGNLLQKTTDYLLEKYSQYQFSIEEFRSDWSNQQMITKENKTNYKPLKIGLYLNCNHTALHSCWLLQDLLVFFNINLDDVHFLIHRPCGAEPQNVKDYMLKRAKRTFKNYLIIKYNVAENKAEIIIENIDKYLNPLLAKTSKSYTDFFLFDDKSILNNYIKKVRELIAKSLYKPESRTMLNKYLDLIVEYYNA